MGNVLDIFNTDAFSLRTMTTNINKIPLQFNYLGSIPGLFNEVGSSTTTVMLEENEGKIALVQNSQRGTQGNVLPREKRKVRPFMVSHKQINDEVLADQVQGVRLFGSETETQTVATVVADKMETAAASLDLTLEYMRVGAVKGIVKDADGSTIYNLYDEFGVTKRTKTLNASKSTSDGSIKKFLNDLWRMTVKKLGQTALQKVVVICGDEIFDAIETSVELRDYLKFFPHPEEEDVISGFHAYRSFTYAKHQFVNYMGFIGDTDFVESNKAYIVPIGVKDLFQVICAPADYTETVNTVGVKYYAKQERMKFDKGVELEFQTNPLVVCTRPAALCEITLGTTT